MNALRTIPFLFQILFHAVPFPALSFCFISRCRVFVLVVAVWLSQIYPKGFVQQTQHVLSCSLLLLLQEWGDPRKEEFYFYMKSYSPVDNVSA